MKNFAEYKQLWILVSIAIIVLHECRADEEGDSEEDMSRTYRFNRPQTERQCQYRRQEGVCRRRSECRRPTRHTCRFGMNPVVCCLDRDETTSTTTTTTTTRPLRTSRPKPPPDNIQKLDITFPGCGSRSPKVSQNPRENGARSISSRRGVRPRGKREIYPASSYKREKRAVIRPVIVGGRESKSNSWPWMVAIFKQSQRDLPKRFLCGASLISRRYVVTAAHCFDAERGNIDPSKFNIVVGSHTSKDGTEYPVESILLHPGYKQRQYYNDLCLMKVGKQVVLNNKTYPVCLPSEGLRSQIRPDVNTVTVTGWGDTTFGGVSSQVLQEVNMPIVPLKECNASYSKVARSNFPQGITNHFICAGLQEGGKDACQGDSGGPMVTRLKNNAWVQLGVVSFGYGCAQAGYPGVYTRLSEYTKWFYDNTDLGRNN